MSYIKDRVSGQLLMPSLAETIADAYR
jgi:hypothetical protein